MVGGVWFIYEVWRWGGLVGVSAPPVAVFAALTLRPQASIIDT